MFLIIILTSFGRNLIKKVFLPREVFLLVEIISHLINFILSLLIFIPIMFFFNISPSPKLVFIPFVVLVQFLLVYGLAMFLSSANVFFKDIDIYKDSFPLLKTKNIEPTTKSKTKLVSPLSVVHTALLRRYRFPAVRVWRRAYGTCCRRGALQRFLEFVS